MSTMLLSFTNSYFRCTFEINLTEQIPTSVCYLSFTLSRYSLMLNESEMKKWRKSITRQNFYDHGLSDIFMSCMLDLKSITDLLNLSDPLKVLHCTVKKSSRNPSFSSSWKLYLCKATPLEVKLIEPEFLKSKEIRWLTVNAGVGRQSLALFWLVRVARYLHLIFAACSICLPVARPLGSRFDLGPWNIQLAECGQPHSTPPTTEPNVSGNFDNGRRQWSAKARSERL